MYRTLCLFAVTAATLVGDVAPTQAQIRFGIGFSSGNGGFYPYGGYGGYPYGYGGYPYGGYGSWWNMDPNLYRRPSSSYGYGYSRPQVQTRTVYVQPQRVGDGQPIKIFTLPDSGTPLSYAINGTEFTLQPGESQLLVYDRQRTITFDRGGDFGTGEYELSSGQYWFELTDKGWELYHDADVSKLTKQTNASGEVKNALPPAPSTLPEPKGKQF